VGNVPVHPGKAVGVASEGGGREQDPCSLFLHVGRMGGAPPCSVGKR